MSGPKSSRYTLTAAQRRMLEQQRKLRLQEEQRRILEEQERKENCIQIKNAVGQIQNMKSSFDRELAIARELTAKAGSDHGMQQLIRDLQNKIQDTVEISRSVESKDAAHVKAIFAQVKQAQIELDLLRQRIEQTARENSQELENDLHAGIADAFSEKMQSPAEAVHDCPEKQEDKILAELETILDAQGEISANLFERATHAKAILAELKDAEHRKNFEAITVRPLLADYQKELTIHQEIVDEYTQIRVTYEALCTSAGIKPKSTSCIQDDLDFLRTEIDSIQNQLAADDEQSYISQSIDEVMTEMGYEVIGQRQVQKKNGRHFKNELYSYDDGTAVNVTYSDDGKITMELGGLDTDDRLPDAAEAKQLCNNMETFCEDFSEIEKRLEAKGVILKSRLSLLPPSADYAQIINVSDYETTAPVDTFRAENRRNCTRQQLHRMKE